MPLTILHPSTIKHSWLSGYDPIETRDALFGFEFPFADWEYREWVWRSNSAPYSQYNVVYLQEHYTGHKQPIVSAYAPLYEWWCAVLDWMYQRFGGKVLAARYRKRSDELDKTSVLHLLFLLHDHVRGALQVSHTGGLYKGRIVEFNLYLLVLQHYLEDKHPNGIEFRFEDYRVTTGERGSDWNPNMEHIITPTVEEFERYTHYWRTQSPFKDLINEILKR